MSRLLIKFVCVLSLTSDKSAMSNRCSRSRRSEIDLRCPVQRSRCTHGRNQAIGTRWKLQVVIACTASDQKSQFVCHARGANGAAGSKGRVIGGLERFGHAVVLVGARGTLVRFGQPLYDLGSPGGIYNGEA